MGRNTHYASVTHTIINIGLILFILSFCPGGLTCAAGSEKPETAKGSAIPSGATTTRGIPDTVEQGDLLSVKVTATLDDGSMLMTTDPEISKSDKVKKSPGCDPSVAPVPMKFIAGTKITLPGLSEKVMGMHVGQKLNFVLSPEEAYGTHDPSLVKQVDRIREIPRTVTMNPQEFVAQSGKIPVVGKEVSLNPYFPSVIREVMEDKVIIENMAMDGVIDGPFGMTEISQKKNIILISLIPSIGAPFEMNSRKGIIVASDKTTFSVDLNHPAAGHPITVQAEVLSIMKAADLSVFELPWTEDHDRGLADAKKTGRPIVMVLYAPWCDWCHKLLEKSFEAPEVKAMKDSYVWIKIDTDKNKQYKALYDQKEYPTVILMASDGRIIKKLEGFKETHEIISELNSDTAASSIK